MEVVHLQLLSQFVASFAKVQVGKTLHEEWLILIKLIKKKSNLIIYSF